MNISQVFANNKVWISEKLKGNTEYFNDLSLGQSPEILYIGCSDSRVSSEELMGRNPERYLFIVILPTWFRILI